MITRIEAYRYRCFEKLDVALGPYQVLVGKNGAGKSTLMDIPVLLGEMLTRQSIQIPLFGERPFGPVRAETPRDVLFNRSGDWCWFALEARLPQVIAEQIERSTSNSLPFKERLARSKSPGRQFGRLRYELGLQLVSEAFEVSHESLFLLPRDESLVERTAGLWTDRFEDDDLLIRNVIRRSSDGVTRIQPEVRLRNEAREREAGRIPIRADVPSHAPALSGLLLDISQFAACHWLRHFLGSGTLPISLDLKAMRRAQRPPGKDYQVAPSGVTLPWSVLDLAERPEEYAEWLDHIGDALPFLSKVSARQREDDLHAYLEVEYDTGVTVKSIGLSDGTWALLALSVLPFLNNVPPLVTVEEPENGIHPKAVETVLESLANLRKSQVLITTHSPVVVAVTPPEQLLCMRQNRSGSVEVIPGPQHPQLKDWQGTPSLATLLSAGIL